MVAVMDWLKLRRFIPMTRFPKALPLETLRFRLPGEWPSDEQGEVLDGECILVGEYMAVSVARKKKYRKSSAPEQTIGTKIQHTLNQPPSHSDHP